jgi:hypothetical protein
MAPSKPNPKYDLISSGESPTTPSRDQERRPLPLARPRRNNLIAQGGIVTVLSRDQLENWLITLSDEERRSLRILWEKYVPTTGTFDLYRFTNGIRNEMRELMQRYITKQISLQEWYDESRRLMKLSYMVAIEKQEEPVNTEMILLVILAFFLYLNSTAIGIMMGTTEINGKLLTRASMYGAAIWPIQHNYTLTARLAQAYECRRVLGPNENHCYAGERPGCIELAQMGWLPIRQMLPLGSAQCLSNCRCDLQYRKTPPITLLSTPEE